LRQQDTKDAAFKRHGDGAIMLAMGHFATRQDGITVYEHHRINADTIKDLPRPIKLTAGFGRTKGAW